MSEQEENVESEKLAEDIRQIKEMGSVTLPRRKARYTLPEHYRSGGGALYFACSKQNHQVMSISYLPLLLSSRIGA